MDTTATPRIAAVPDLPCTGIRKSCPCRSCARKRKQYRREYDRGLRRTCDAAACRQHLQMLARLKIGLRTISRATGVTMPSLLHIAKGSRTRIKIDTARRILGFTPADAATIANDALVDATATRLRFQALIALGYTQEYISHATGRSNVDFDLRDRIKRRRALAILELCKQVGDTPGPSRKAALQARRKGWRPPADYDEELFYEPSWDGTEPETLTICRSFDYVAEYDFLAPTTPIADIADRLGITVAYLRVLLSKRARGVAPFGHASELVAPAETVSA